MCAIAQIGAARTGKVSAVAAWTATASANATPEQVLEVLTDPSAIRRWSPVDFDLDDLDSRRSPCRGRLCEGTRVRVTGRVAGVGVGFEVEVHAAGEDGLELSAEGPFALEVRYALASEGSGAQLSASVSIRGGRGLTGRLVSNAAATLLSAGALDSATQRIVRAAEDQSPAVAGGELRLAA